MSHVQNFPPQAAACRAQAQPPCPECHGATQRVWRRPVDRLSAFLMPTRRYRCQSFQCQWEGNIRQGARTPPDSTFASDAPSDASGLSRVFLLSMAIALAAAAFIVVATYTDWLEPGGVLVSATAKPSPPFTST